MYLLDTDICSYAMKRSHQALIEKIRGFAPGELRVSAVTVFELEYGACRSGRYKELARVIHRFLANVEILPFNALAAGEAGAVRAELEAEGMVIGAYDLLIAGHARSLGAKLVTNNVREFSRVVGLQLENWTPS